MTDDGTDEREADAADEAAEGDEEWDDGAGGTDPAADDRTDGRGDRPAPDHGVDGRDESSVAGRAGESVDGRDVGTTRDRDAGAADEQDADGGDDTGTVPAPDDRVDAEPGDGSGGTSGPTDVDGAVAARENGSGDAAGSGGVAADAGSGATEANPGAGETDADAGPGGAGANGDGPDAPVEAAVPEDVRKYERFKKMDGAQYERANDFLRERTYITAREWAIARLCADFRTETGVEMTKIGENLPELVPFMEDTYTPQAVNQARHSFEEKVRQAGATFLYGAMCDFFTADELDELMYEVTEVAKFLLEVEGVDLSVEEELEAEDRISSVMREVRSASEALRYVECPECGHELRE
jgi:hypothetical protein